MTFVYSVTYADGNSFNIISHGVIDEEKLKVSTVVVERSRNRVKHEEMEAKFAIEELKKQLLAEDRKLNHISFNHWQKELDRGYDPIFRNDLTMEHTSSPQLAQSQNVHFPKNDIGTPGRQLQPPQVPRPASVWERLQKDDANNVTALFNATGKSSTIQLMNAAVKRKNSEPHIEHVRQPKPQVRTGSAALSGRQNDNNNGSETQNKIIHRDLTKSSENAETQPFGLTKNNSSSVLHAATSQDSKHPALNRNVSMPALSSTKPIPQLDLSRTKTPPAVSYDTSNVGPPGQAIPMVRTGGGGFFEDY